MVSVIVTMPAQWVLQQLPANSAMKWGNATGSWHHFSLSWVGYKTLVWSDVNVELKASCLLSAQVCLNIHNEDNTIQLTGHLLDKILTVSSTEITLDLSDIQTLLPPLLVQPTGGLKLQIEQLAVEQPNRLTALAGKLQWSSIGIQGEQFNLGNVIAKASYQQPYIVIKLNDQSQVMDLNGTIKLDKQGQVISNINIKPLKGFPSSIKSLITSSMQRQATGFYSVNSRQRIPAIQGLAVQF